MRLNSEKILITGVDSGLGKYIFNSLPGSTGLNRKNKTEILEKKEHYDLIIHAAFNSKRNIDDYYQYVQDNIFLTKELCEVEHKKMVYISSIDVYSEEHSNYKLSKLIAESVVENCANKYLILRCSAIIGPTMRNNTFMRLYSDDRPIVGLTAYSTFNYISQSDVLKTILKSQKQDVNGVYDFVSSTNVSLLEVAKFFKKSPQLQFGAYTYHTPAIKNNKLIKTFPELDKTSKQVIKNYIEAHNE